MFNVRNISLGKVKRHLKFPYRVSLLGYMDNNPPLKNVRQFFPDRLEINIRLNGRENSVMLLDGTEYVCKSPHVVIKKPKTYYEFRSLPDRNVIYICYESSLMEDFEKAGLFNGALAWEIERNSSVEFLLNKICDAMNRSRENGVADRIDLDCFALLNELMFQRQNLKKDTENSERELIMQADSYLHFNVAECVDFEELAGSLGMSKSTFFRHWKKYFRETPADHFRNLKLDEAVRLLVVGRYKVFEIAQMLRFSSSAYFCAVFRKRFGMTPQQYAAEHERDL